MTRARSGRAREDGRAGAGRRAEALREGRAGVEARAEGREGDARGETEIRDRASDERRRRDGNRRRGDDGDGMGRNARRDA